MQTTWTIKLYCDHGDMNNKLRIDNTDFDASPIVWHKKCYADFTHRDKIKRLETAANARRAGRPLFTRQPGLKNL